MRKFIPKFSLRAKPLFQTTGDAFRWGDEEERAFDDLRLALTSSPVLAHPVPDRPFVIEVDASIRGLGAILLQADDDGKERVIEYASRLLKAVEKKWHPQELEALGVLWACETWHVWIQDKPTVVRTDHESLSLKWLAAPENGPRLHRWAARLAAFNLTVQYKRGRTNRAADALSRSGMDTHPQSVGSEETPDYMVLAVNAFETFSPNVLREEQRNDKWVSRIFAYLYTGKGAQIARHKKRRLEAWTRDFRLCDGLVYRGKLVVIPSSMRRSILCEVHEGVLSAHLAADKVYSVLAKRCWWSGMRRDVEAYCSACLSCARASRYNSARHGKLQPIVTAGPWHVVAMDVFGPIPHRTEEEAYVLVMVDHYTKYLELAALVRKSSRAIARAFEEKVVCRHGVPRRVITDDGSEFKGEMSTLWKRLGVEHSPVLPYHQQANGLAERHNQMLGKMIRILREEEGAHWTTRLAGIAMGYNMTFHRAIQNTPFFLNHLRDPRIALDNALPEAMDENLSVREYLKSSSELSKDITEWTDACLEHSRDTMKSAYDKGQRDIKFMIGDMVLVREEGARPKSDMIWSLPHRVTAVEGNGLRLSVKPVYGPGPAKVVSVQRVRPFAESHLNPLDVPSVEGEMKCRKESQSRELICGPSLYPGSGQRVDAISHRPSQSPTVGDCTATKPIGADTVLSPPSLSVACDAPVARIEVTEQPRDQPEAAHSVEGQVGVDLSHSIVGLEDLTSLGPQTSQAVGESILQGSLTSYTRQKLWAGT